MDLTVARLDAPLRAGPARRCPSSGCCGTSATAATSRRAAFDYRYVLSANEAITVQDLPLELITAAGAGRAATPAGARERGGGDDLVRIPAGVAPGIYYIGLIIDPTTRTRSSTRRTTPSPPTGRSRSPPRVSRSWRRRCPTPFGHALPRGAGRPGGDGAYGFALEPAREPCRRAVPVDRRRALRGAPDLPRGAGLRRAGRLGVHRRPPLREAAGACPLRAPDGGAERRLRAPHRRAAGGGAQPAVQRPLPRWRVRPYLYGLAAGEILPNGFALSQGGW